MAAPPYQLSVTAAQVGTYFVGQYYQMLQHQPELVHQFYNNGSTMLRIDGNTRDAASAMLQIHERIMSLNYTAVEIKTVHALESWNGGVLVMVTGSVHIKDYKWRKFMQTFFLGPQEKGFFVLNDIFHFTDDEPLHHHAVAYSAPSNHDLELNAPATLPNQVPNYILEGQTYARGFEDPSEIKENGQVDNYSYSEQQLQHSPKVETVFEDNFAQANGTRHSSLTPIHDHLPAPAEEAAVEPQKHTYASIVAKAPSAAATPPQPKVNKPASPSSEWNHVPEPPTQYSVASSAVLESSGVEVAEGASVLDDEGEIRSVYVKNLPYNVSAQEIQEEFAKFGKLTPDAVAIRTRKDAGLCYAFVEFEDMDGVQNAIKAATVEIAGQQVFIEERRPNRYGVARGGGRRGRGGRGGGYYTDAPRGRFGGRSYGSRGNNNGYDGEYYNNNNNRRPARGGNGYYRPTNRRDRSHSRNGQQHQSED